MLRKLAKDLELGEWLILPGELIAIVMANWSQESRPHWRLIALRNPNDDAVTEISVPEIMVFDCIQKN